MRESNCGSQPSGLFGSLPTMKSLTVGYVRASCARKATYRAPLTGFAEIAFAGFWKTENVSRTPRAAASSTAASSASCRSMCVGCCGFQMIASRFSVSPTAAIVS